MDVLVLQVAAGLEKDGHNTWGYLVGMAAAYPRDLLWLMPLLDTLW